MTYKYRYSILGFDFVLYQDLNRKHSLEVLSYRNHPEIRKWMINDTPISEESHLKFIENLKNRNDKYYYAVFRKNKIFACIYFDVLKKTEYYVGHFLNPNFGGMGFYFEYIYLKFFFEFLKAENIKMSVKKNNIKMININKLLEVYCEELEDQEYYHYSIDKKKFMNFPDNITDFISNLTNNLNAC